MTHHTKTLGNKMLTALMVSVMSIGFVTGAAAAKLGVDANTSVGAGASPSAGVGTGVGADVNTDTPAAGQAIGSPDSHMSTTGSAHTKSQWGSGASRPAEGTNEHSKMHGHTKAHMNTKSKE